MPKARVEEDEAVEVRVEGLEVVCFVHGVVVFDEGGDFGVVAEAVLDDASEGVPCCSFR